MQSFIFIDLDDTLFQTLRKCEQYTSGDSDAKFKPRAYLKDGSPISYSTAKQDKLWEWLSNTAALIPVTARNFDAFSRVTLPFANEVILNHGAVILDKNRQMDSEWGAYMAKILPDYQHDLFDLWKQVEHYALSNPSLRPRLIDDFGMIWYGVIKHQDANEEALNELLEAVIAKHEAVVSGRLYWHANSNNLAVIPSVVGKAHAVKFLMEKYALEHGNVFTVGMGDSKTDLPFMSLCDYTLIPKNTQLGKLFHVA